MPGLARGCPQRLAVTQARSSRPTSILSMGLDATGNYLAILTRHDLQVWHGGQHNILLGFTKLKRPPAEGGGEEGDEWDENDAFVKPAVVWSRSSKEVCVLGLDGTLTFFSVTADPNVPVFAGIDPPEWMDVPPGDGGISPWLDSPNAVIVKEQRTLADVKGTCLTAGLWAHHLLIGKEDKEPTLLDVSWSGNVAAEYQLRVPEPIDISIGGRQQQGEDEKEEAPAPPPAVLVHMDYSDVCHLLAAVLSDGRALICNVPSPTFSVIPVPVPPDLSPGIDVMGAVEVATFSPNDAVLAAGYDDGSVAIYRVLYVNTYTSPRRVHAPSLGDLGLSHSRSASMASDTSPGHHHHHHQLSSSGSNVGVICPTGGAEEITLILARRLSLDSLGFEIRHVGPVLTMEFSPDGGSLAVGHGWHSLNVWDTSQWCRPMTTFPRVPQTPTGEPSLGIACIIWGHRGYRLLVAQNELTENTVCGSIIRYELLKWARHAAMADTPLCLQGVGSVALLEQRPWNPRLLSWTHINVPPAYAVNLPVALVAVSPSGQHIALAGRRGLALYNQSQRKWRLFGNVHQERELQVAGLAWWREEVVVVVAKQKTAFVILLYPRTHLDKASLLNEPVHLPPGTRPLFLDCVADEEHGIGSTSTAQNNTTADGHQERSTPRPSFGTTDRSRGGGLRSSQSPSMASTMSTTSLLSTSMTLAPSTSSSSSSSALPPATLIVGDSNCLLTYRLTPEPGNTAASITFLYDLKMPVHRGPRPHTQGDEMGPPSPASSVRSGASSSSHQHRQHQHSASSQHHHHQSSSSLPFTPRQLYPHHMAFGETPRRVCLLPGLQPRAVAVLVSTGTLYKLELGTGSMSVVATSVSNFWEIRLPCAEERMRPAYLLYCGDNGFSLWLPSLRDDKASELTLEACRSPFLEPTFNPDVEGVLMGVHGPTNSLIFLTQTCLQPQTGPADPQQAPIPPRFAVGLQRRPIYQVVFRYLLFLHGMLRGRMYSEDVAQLVPKQVDHHHHHHQVAMAELVHNVVVGVFDELYAHPETRIHLADALDFLVRSCIEAVAIAHSRMKRKTATKQKRDKSPFTSLATAIEQVREALLLCRRESSLTLFYEVIVRVARKVEPSRQKYIFPLPDLDGQGVGDTPVSLFEKCLRARKLHTAILYLPLIESHCAAVPQHIPPSSSSQRTTAKEEEEAEDVHAIRLVHSSALKLLWECLRRNRREWRMLKQLWRFIIKRQEALQIRSQLSHSGGGGGGHRAPLIHNSPHRPPHFASLQQGTLAPPETPKRPLLGLLYRVTVGMLTPSSSTADALGTNKGPDLDGSSVTTGSSASALYSGTITTKPTSATAAGSEEPVAEEEEEEEEPGMGTDDDAEEAAPPADLTFHLLRYAETGRDVVTVFCSLCLATLRLKDLIDALLLLDKPDPLSVPYPSLRPYGNRLPDFPWARFEAPTDILLDCFLAIREQFTDSAAAGLGPQRSGYCTTEQRLSILQTICRELRDFECLLALGTFQKDFAVVRIALDRGRVGAADYGAIFLDERLEIEQGIRDMVRQVVTPPPPRASPGLVGGEMARTATAGSGSASGSRRSKGGSI